MDKRKFLKAVYGEVKEEYVPYVDDVIGSLVYREQLLIRLKYNGVPFTKISKILNKSPYMVSLLHKDILKSIKFNWSGKIDKIWSGKISGLISIEYYVYNMKENSKEVWG